MNNIIDQVKALCRLKKNINENINFFNRYVQLKMILNFKFYMF